MLNSEPKIPQLTQGGDANVLAQLSLVKILIVVVLVVAAWVLLKWIRGLSMDSKSITRG
jgi:small-conductance mechanosensitive channel